MVTLNEMANKIVYDGKNNELNNIHQENVHRKVKDLLIALHDAINKPKGVVPNSAEIFYCQDLYATPLTINDLKKEMGLSYASF